MLENFRNNFEKNEEEITKEDQEAFSLLAKDLILNNSETELPPLSFENREIISNAILADFTAYCFENYDAKEGIKTKYDIFSFTAKLSELSKKKDEEDGLPLNCVGSLFLKIGLMHLEEAVSPKEKEAHKIYFGIAADHPVIFKILNDGSTIIYDGNSELSGEGIKVSGAFEQKDGYQIYRTENGQTIQDQKMFFVHSTEVGILHEIFHNIDILKRSEDDETLLLPGAEDKGLSLNSSFKEVLNQADWNKIRKILFPEVEHSFQENHEEWESEIQRIKNLRREGKDSYFNAVGESKNLLGFENLSIREFAIFIKPKFKKYAEIVDNYFNYLVWESGGFPVYKDPNTGRPTSSWLSVLTPEQMKEVDEKSILHIPLENEKKDGKAQATGEDFIQDIDDEDVKIMTRILGKHFRETKSATQSLYFRMRVSQNILDKYNM